MIAQANSSKDCPYLNTRAETKSPIDQPIRVKLKKRKSDISPIQINEN